MHDFYVSLPSNTFVDGDYERQNTTSSFRVRLPNEINLGNGDWEVALVEIQYPHSWNNITNETFTRAGTQFPQNQIVVKFTNGEYKTFSIPVGNYSNIDMLLAAIRKAFDSHSLGKFKDKEITLTDKIWFDYDYVNQRVVFRKPKLNDSVNLIIISPQLKYILGFDRLFFYDQDNYTSAKYPPDIRGGTDSMYIYCNIVKPQIIGNSMEQVLRIIPVSGEYGDIVDKQFNPAHYVPVLQKQFGSIEITIKTDQDKPFAFQFGKSIVKLHFKRKALRI